MKRVKKLFLLMICLIILCIGYIPIVTVIAKTNSTKNKRGLCIIAQNKSRQVKDVSNIYNSKSDRNISMISENVTDFYLCRINTFRLIRSFKVEISSIKSKRIISYWSFDRSKDHDWQKISQRELSKNDLVALINILNYINLIGMQEHVNNNIESSRNIHESSFYCLSFYTNGVRCKKSVNVAGLYSGISEQREIFNLMLLDRFIERIYLYKDDGRLLYWK